MTDVLAVSSATVGQLSISGVVTGCVYALVAVGFNIIFNGAGMINFAQGEFVVLGGFLFYALTTGLGLPLLPAVVLAVAGVALVGVLIQVGVVRVARGEGVIGRDVATLGVALLLIAFMAAVWGVDPLPVRAFTPGDPVLSGTVTMSRQDVWIVVATIAAAGLLQLFFSRTTMGISIRAASLNASAARGVGLSVNRIAMLSWALGAGLAGLAGVLITPTTGVAVTGAFVFTLNGFAAAILGGLGSMVGALVGGLTLGLVTSLSAAFIPSGWQGAVPMLVLLLVLMARPSGILGRGPARV